MHWALWRAGCPPRDGAHAWRRASAAFDTTARTPLRTRFVGFRSHVGSHAGGATLDSRLESRGTRKRVRPSHAGRMARGWFICGGSSKDTVPRPPLRESEGDEVSVKPAPAGEEKLAAGQGGRFAAAGGRGVAGQRLLVDAQGPRGERGRPGRRPRPRRRQV